MSKSKIQLLVITDLFPRNEKDIRGIFIKDYLISLALYCDIDLIYVDQKGEKPGLVKAKLTENITTYSYFYAEKTVKGLKKALQWKRRINKAKELAENVKYNKQIIHAHGSIFSGTVAKQIANKWKIPFVVTEHTGPFSTIANSLIKRKAAKKVLEKADVVFTVSGLLKSEIEKAEIYPKKVVVTYNPVNTRLFQNKTNKKEYKNFLFIGRLDSFKGAYRTLRAFHKITDNFPEWTYTIIGNGEDLDKIASYIAKHEEDLADKVILKGKCNKESIASSINDATFCVLPSEHESFGLVVAEAMACGRPVLIGESMASVEFVTEQCGMKVPVRNNNALAAALVVLMKDAHTYNSELIRNQIVKNFGFESFGEKLVTNYKELI